MCLKSSLLRLAAESWLSNTFCNCFFTKGSKSISNPSRLYFKDLPQLLIWRFLTFMSQLRPISGIKLISGISFSLKGKLVERFWPNTFFSIFRSPIIFIGTLTLMVLFSDPFNEIFPVLVTSKSANNPPPSGSPLSANSLLLQS